MLNSIQSKQIIFFICYRKKQRVFSNLNHFYIAEREVGVWGRSCVSPASSWPDRAGCLSSIWAWSMPGNDEHAQKFKVDSLDDQSQAPLLLCSFCKPNVLHVIKVKYTSHCAKFVGQVQHLSATRYFLQCGFYSISQVLHMITVLYNCAGTLARYNVKKG